MRTALSGCVDMLAAGALRTIGVDPQILLGDLYIGLITEVGDNINTGKAGCDGGHWRRTG